MDNDMLVDYYRKLDRALFVGYDLKEYAMTDRPLPIGYGQTISQPSLVLEMTRLLSPGKDNRVLEIGTGSGYQTALLAYFPHQVYTVERIRELSDKAKKVLDSLGINNVIYIIGDGSGGWQKNAPYDRIMVTAAASMIPQELIDQLAPEGRMVIPVGPQGRQELTVITKEASGKISTYETGRVIFVEMKGKYGWSSF